MADDTAVITGDVIDEWLVGQASIVKIMKSALETMDKDDKNAIMDFLEVNLANNEDALMYYCCKNPLSR